MQSNTCHEAQLFDSALVTQLWATHVMGGLTDSLGFRKAQAPNYWVRATGSQWVCLENPSKKALIAYSGKTLDVTTL